MDNLIVTIKCITCGSIEGGNYYIKVLDCNKNIICESYTDEFGCIRFNAKEGAYKLIIIQKNCVYRKISTSIFICKNLPNTFTFLVNNNVYNLFHTIKVILTDRNYSGLKIEKGEMIYYGT